MAHFPILMWDIWCINLFMFIAYPADCVHSTHTDTHTPVLNANHFMAAVKARQPLNALINKINWLGFYSCSLSDSLTLVYYRILLLGYYRTLFGMIALFLAVHVWMGVENIKCNYDIMTNQCNNDIVKSNVFLLSSIASASKQCVLSHSLLPSWSYSIFSTISLFVHYGRAKCDDMPLLKFWLNSRQRAQCRTQCNRSKQCLFEADVSENVASDACMLFHCIRQQQKQYKPNEKFTVCSLLCGTLSIDHSIRQWTMVISNEFIYTFDWIVIDSTLKWC